MNDKNLLEKIIKYCDMLNDTINQFGNSFDVFSSSHIFQNSACMCLLQIGELCKYIRPEFKTKHENIDWKGWSGMRDVFAHQYGKLNLQLTWKTIRVEFPEFNKKIRVIFNSL